MRMCWDGGHAARKERKLQMCETVASCSFTPPPPPRIRSGSPEKWIRSAAEWASTDNERWWQGRLSPEHGHLRRSKKGEPKDKRRKELLFWKYIFLKIKFAHFKISFLSQFSREARENTLGPLFTAKLNWFSVRESEIKKKKRPI